MAGWHHQCNGHELGQTSGDGTGRPGVLQSMGSQTVGHDWATEQQCPCGDKCAQFSCVDTLTF